MKIVQWIQQLLDHELIILGLAFLVIKLLDWYNPFMDFSDHAQWLQYLLGISAIVSGVLHLLSKSRKQHGLR